MTIARLSHLTATLTLLHAAVDALCACSVLGLALWLDVDYTKFVAYNVLAFMTQPLVGCWHDRSLRQAPSAHWRRVRLLGVAIVLLLAGAMVGVWLSAHPEQGGAHQQLLVWLMVVLLGLGNSCFHIYGGKQVAVRSGNDLRHLGIFVASGALGIWLGHQPLGQGYRWWLMGLMGVLLLGGWRAVRLDADGEPVEAAAVVMPDSGTQGHTPYALLLLLMLLVFLRSFFGQLVSDDLSGPLLGLLALIAAVMGKAAGGYVAQRWGVWCVLTVAFVLAGVGFLLGYYWLWALLAMVLCLNLTMPLTLGLANRALPGREGLAFGLLAFTLSPGVALGLLRLPDEYLLLYAWVATVIIELLVLLVLGERRRRVLAFSLVINVLTNLPLNVLLLFYVYEPQMQLASLIGEVVVVVVETLLFWPVTRRLRQALLYAVACNVASCLIGLLYQLLLSYL